MFIIKVLMIILMLTIFVFGDTGLLNERYFNSYHYQEFTPLHGSVDLSGNLIVGGYFYNDTNKIDVIISKYSPDGSCLWEKTFDSGLERNEFCCDVKTDGEGNVITVVLLENTASKSIFIIAKYGSSGDVIWKYQKEVNMVFTRYSQDHFLVVEIDNNNDLIIGNLCELEDLSLKFDILKLNKTGELLWEYEYYPAESKINSINKYPDGIQKIIIDSNNSIYILGNKQHLIGENDLVLVKISSEGEKIWDILINNECNLDDLPYDMVMENDVIRVIGCCRDNSNFFSTFLWEINDDGQIIKKELLDIIKSMDKMNIKMLGGSDSFYLFIDWGNMWGVNGKPVFLEKYDLSGKKIWSKEIKIGEYRFYHANDLCYDDEYNIYTLGGVDDEKNSFIGKFRSNGEIEWLIDFNHTGMGVESPHFYHDLNNGLYITGIGLDKIGFMNYQIMNFDFAGKIKWNKEIFRPYPIRTKCVNMKTSPNGLIYTCLKIDDYKLLDYNMISKGLYYQIDCLTEYNSKYWSLENGDVFKEFDEIKGMDVNDEGDLFIVYQGMYDDNYNLSIVSFNDYGENQKTTMFSRDSFYKFIGLSILNTSGCYLFSNGSGGISESVFSCFYSNDYDNWFREYVSPEGGDCYCGAGLTDWRGHLIILGREERSGENEFLFLRYDSTGTLLKDLKQGTGERKLFPVQGESTKDHRFKALCRYEEGIEKGVLTFCLDEEGNIQESLELSGHWEEEGYLKMFQSSEEDIFIAGQSGEKARVAKVSSLGAEMWSKEYDMSGKDSLTDARMDSFGNLYLLLNGEIGEKKRASILKLDGEGEVLWNQTCLDSFPYDVHGLTICLNNEDNLMVFGKLSKGEEWDIAYLLQYSQTGTPVLESYPKESREGEKSFVRYYPNPFYDRLTIEMDLGISEDVDIRLYNLLGQEIEKIYQGRLPAGKQIIHWRSERRLSSGIYFMKVKMGENEIIKKITYLK